MSSLGSSLKNVPGFVYEGKSEALAFIRDEVDRINREREVEYRVTAKVLQAADYGVPQLRERFILVASREARPFVFPAPTHYPAKQNRRVLGQESATAPPGTRLRTSLTIPATISHHGGSGMICSPPSRRAKTICFIRKEGKDFRSLGGGDVSGVSS